MSEPSARHRAAARDQVAACAVLTVSDTRTAETDLGGDLIVEGLICAGHQVIERRIVRDDPPSIQACLEVWIRAGQAQVVLITGGTGVSRRDTTIEVVERLLDKELPGFGELFRMLSWEEIGSAAMLSRAIAGLAGSCFLFSMPGSPAAVRLALEKLILPELPHLLWERRR